MNCLLSVFSKISGPPILRHTFGITGLVRSTLSNHLWWLKNRTPVTMQVNSPLSDSANPLRRPSNHMLEVQSIITREKNWVRQTFMLFINRSISFPTTEFSHECYCSHALRISGSLDTQIGRLHERLFASYNLGGRRSELSLGERLM